MAYLDLASPFTAPQGAAIDAPKVQSEMASFSPLEWTVVALARRDSIASLRQPGAIARAMGSLFGLGRRSMLADPRLEALRRMAVHAWHRGFAVPGGEVRRFVEAGFTTDHAETLLASISSRRHAGRRTTVS